MEYRTLGRTGIKVSAICLGTMTWGDQNTEADGHAQMDYAVEQGINFFDTAEMYTIPPKRETQGNTERIIGSWFKARGGRDKIVLASKVAGRGEADWLRADGRKTELDPKSVEEACNASLKRLGTDYIDLYQVHWPDRAVSVFGSNPTVFRQVSAPEIPIAETLGALARLVEAGKVRHIGLSNESAWGAMTWLKESEAKRLPRVQSIQNAYSLVNRTFEVNLAEVAMREDLGLLAYSSLAQGYLTGKYRDGALPEGTRKTLYNRLQRYEKPGAAEAIHAYVDLAAELGLDPAQMALAFVTSRPFVTATIIGASRMEQLKTDIASIDVRITPEVEERIDALHQLTMNRCP